MSTPKTPRLRSAYPLSPPQETNNLQRSSFPIARAPLSKEAKTPIRNKNSSHGPVVPLATLDGPTQRLYVAAVYLALLAWRLYDYFSLVADHSSSLWLFVKWSTIDGIFLYGLPGLRIPWLEWGAFTMTSLFFSHAAINAVLMFRIPIPVEGWLIGLGKIFYDRELAISERRVKASSLLQNSSLILGKQIIHILPEGTAVLNANQEPFCIGNGQSIAHLPIKINQTMPTSVELLRTDLESSSLETIQISAKDIRRLKKGAEKRGTKANSASTIVLQVPVKQTGLYRLGRIVDESNLEVQKIPSAALVVQCPSAYIKPGTQHRCREDLSNFFIEVDATPPLRIDYTRTINRGDSSSISLTWQPEGLESPLISQRTSSVVNFYDSDGEVSWARRSRQKISVNETMGSSGGWQYRIDRIQDGCGNIVHYNGTTRSGSAAWSGHGRNLEQDFIVHQRPRARLSSCTSQKPLRLPSGESSHLPVEILPNSHTDVKDSKHYLQYSFSPTTTEDNGSHAAENSRVESITISPDGRGPLISSEGLYKLETISTDHCVGEILEPSSCLLVNPPSPELTVIAEEIPDKCAGHSVGTLVNLDLLGSPPFTLFYSEQKQGGPLIRKQLRIATLRHQISFEPREAGQFTYSFNELSDSVYKSPKALGLKGRGDKVEQWIKPTAWARFSNEALEKRICQGHKTSFSVKLTGEGPWSLDYEIIHEKSRQKKYIENINNPELEIETPELSRGGVYSMALTGVTDSTGCKIFLDQEARVIVRQEKPTAGFAQINGDRSIRILQGEKQSLPLRLSGEAPWEVVYSKEDGSSERRERITSSNAFIEVTGPGTYELKSVQDSACPGLIDTAAANFKIAWLERPSVNLVNNEGFKQSGNANVRRPVCESDQDSVEVSLTGRSPFKLEYRVTGHPDRNAQFSSSKKESYASNLASMQMDTKKPGLYKYVISGVGDGHYEVSKKKENLISFEQRVYPRPSATFVNAGRTYNHCPSERYQSETIPVSLIGRSPFAIDIEIKHQAGSKPETRTISGIMSDRYDLVVEDGDLTSSGNSISILRVSDANGCRRTIERSSRESVHVNVVEIPSINPVEDKVDYCVGDRISYTLAGNPPFNVFYSFENKSTKAAIAGTSFRRLAEKPGVFTIEAVSDRASTDSCRARTYSTKIVHELPSVRISRGKTKEVDIHEGGDAEILFEFGGTPPFYFTYTRSTNAEKGKRSVVLETKHDHSEEYSKSIRAHEEGTYEVVAIRDKYCGVTLQGSKASSPSQKRR